MKKPNRRSDCPIGFGVDLFGDKWTLLILRDMILMEKSSYGDFLRSEEAISTNILADRLAFLEQQGVIDKTTDPYNKSKFIYSPRQKGLDIFPILVEIMLWSYKYDSQTPLSADFISMITVDKEAFIKSHTEH